MWKDIIGWEKYYEVNDNGSVRNKLTGHLLIGDVNGEGYRRVCLYNKYHSPSKQRFFRHRLVAQHFIANPNNLPEVNHKDGCIENNSVENLEWVTKKENELHSHKYGKKEYKPFVVEFNNGKKKIFDTKSNLSNILNVTPHTVKCWLSHSNYGYKNKGIKEIYYITNLKV